MSGDRTWGIWFETPADIDEPAGWLANSGWCLSDGMHTFATTQADATDRAQKLEGSSYMKSRYWAKPLPLEELAMVPESSTPEVK